MLGVIDKRFLLISILLILISIILECYFYVFISNKFNYFGYNLNLSLIKYIESKIFFGLFLIFSYRLFKKSEFLYAIFTLLMFFFFIPNSILFAYMNGIRGPIYSISILLLIFIIFSPIKFKFSKITVNNNYLILFFIIIIFILILPFIINYGLKINFKTLIFKDIYETRNNFTAHSNKILDYLYNWIVKVIVPVALVFFLINKKYFFSLITIITLIYLYLISGNKAVYLATFVILFFFFMGSDYLNKIRIFLFIIIFFLLIIAPIDYLILNNFTLRGIFINRLLFFPALLNNYYFDFFNGKPLYFSENSIFNLFFVYPYNVPSPILISQVYFNTSEMYANNGIISDGFINLGYFGVVFISILFTGIFMIFNSLTVDKRYFGIFFIFVFFFLSTQLFTVLITSGIFILFFLFYIIKK